ncbi:MAG: S-layer homology domain-containing protein [Candidatus Margulisiibacteriota bacterium]
MIKKLTIIFLMLSPFLLLPVPSVFAFSDDGDVYRLKDVPYGHYAYGAVARLLELGVTKGFPDDTYQGHKPLSRYEGAAFLTKFETAEDKLQAEHEKLLAELRAEVNLLKIPKKENLFSFRGMMDGEVRSGQVGGASNSQFSYRLALDLDQKFDESSGLKIGFDSMDSGFNNAQRDLVRELLAVEGWIKFNGSTLTVSSGPGDVVHLSDPLFPSENGTVYRRLKRGVKLATSYRNTAFGVEYLARSSDPTGLVSEEELSFPLLQNFRGFKVGINPRLFVNGERKAAHFDLTVRAAPTANLRYELLIGAGRLTDFDQGLYFKGELSLWNKLTLIGQKIGGLHRGEGYYPIYDTFSHPLSDGAYELGFRYWHEFNNYYLLLAGDQVGPGSNQIAELTLGNKLSAYSMLELKYRLAGGVIASSIAQLGLKTVF